MRDVHSHPHVGEMEAIAEADERQADKMVAHKLLEILARSLHAEDENDGLLCPVRGLEKVVELENVFVRHVREALVHSGGVEVPHGCPAHDIHAPGAAESEVCGGVHLFHEAGLFALGLDAGVTGQGLQQLLHDELARERQDDNVEGDKGKVPRPLAILRGSSLGRALRDGQLVAEEDEVVDRVRLGWIQGVEAAEDGQQKGGQCPCVLDGIVGGLLGEAACLASLGRAFGCGRVFSVGSLFERHEWVSYHGLSGPAARAAR